MLMISDVASPTFSASHALQEEIRQTHTHRVGTTGREGKLWPMERPEKFEQEGRKCCDK